MHSATLTAAVQSCGLATKTGNAGKIVTRIERFRGVTRVRWDVRMNARFIRESPIVVFTGVTRVNGKPTNNSYKKGPVPSSYLFHSSIGVYRLRKTQPKKDRHLKPGDVITFDLVAQPVAGRLDPSTGIITCVFRP